MSKSTGNSKASAAVYQAALWHLTHALRNGTDSAKYTHVVLGLLFFKYISEALEEHARLNAERGKGLNPEDLDEHDTQDIFSVLPWVRWAHPRPSQRQRSRPSALAVENLSGAPRRQGADESFADGDKPGALPEPSRANILNGRSSRRSRRRLRRRAPEESCEIATSR